MSENLPSKYAINARMIVQGYEWGPAVPKVIVEFNDNVTGFDKDTFKLVTSNCERKIIDVYPSDSDGNRHETIGKYIAFDLQVGTFSQNDSSYGEASPFSYDQKNSHNIWADSYELELDLKDSKTFKIGDVEYGPGKNPWITFRKNLADSRIVPDLAFWKKDSFKLKDENFTLQRASFTPKGAGEIDGVKNPLIIWLHGAGEGGSNVEIALLGNKVTALAKESIQKYFTTEKQKGAYVLVLQTPTFWADSGDGIYNPTPRGTRQTSMYDKALFAAIQDYVSSHPGIDTNRIYIGGCSNGGYMTMNMMFEHGDFFTAFYPICEVYMDGNISDEMIHQVRDYNIWFLHSENDTTVDPLSTSIPTFYRLINAGAQNVHYTLTDKVVGTDSPSAIYKGHTSWIYAFNDQVKKEFDNRKVQEDFKRVTIVNGTVTSNNNYVTHKNCNQEGNMWEWLSKQSK